MKYISVSEAAKRWNVTERSIRNYCSTGKIKGAYQQGKYWMIPEDSFKPTTNNSLNIDLATEMLNFINNSPVSFQAIDNVCEMLNKAGYRRLEESSYSRISYGDKVYFVRNGTSLVALNVGNSINEENYPFHIIASHSDSPCFKIKPECDGKTDIYNKINVEPYGGLLCAPWLDRPLGIAGRVLLKKNGKIISTNVNLDEDLVVIPNLCIHFNRDANSGHSYNMASEMQAFIGQELEGSPLKDKLCLSLNCKPEDIINFDLYLYNHQKGVIWGKEKEYISSPRLDDLECVFTSAKAFGKSDNENAINVLYISDNEEVGSSSRQGADGDFLETIINRVSASLEFGKETVGIAFANSFLISADNAHAVHPNNPGITDANNKCYMNKGIAIKFNASQRYTSDAISSAIFQEICNNAKVPYQFFANRSDVRGGSTLGNILLTHTSLLSVDIGLPQLAMHSCYETAGSKDIQYAVDAFSKFYSSEIFISDNQFEVK